MPEHLILALIGGLGFGYICYRMGATGERVAVMLFALWALNPLMQDIYRALEGKDVLDEFILVTSIRLVQAITAIIVVEVLNRRENHGQMG